MVVVGEPDSHADAARWRHLVHEHKARERRWRFPAVLHLGAAGRPEVGHVVESGDELDHAVRCDMLEAMLRRARGGPLMTWLTRPGTIEVQDVDLAWLRAVRAVNGETGRALRYLVVTRTGWHEPVSGATRTWLRLRDR